MDTEKILDGLLSNSIRESLPPGFFHQKRSLPLINIFNTCFVNVVLQSLFHTMPLTTNLLEGKFQEALQHVNDPKMMLFLYYIKMNSKTWNAENSVSLTNSSTLDGTSHYHEIPMRPAYFVHEMRKYLPLYEWGRQHDAQETLIWLLNSFHDCMSRLVVHRIEGEPTNKLDKMRIEATLQWANNYSKTKFHRHPEVSEASQATQATQASQASQELQARQARQARQAQEVVEASNLSNSSKDQVEILIREKALEYQSEYSSILKIFGGQFLERLNCEGCNEINHKYVSFLSSELALPSLPLKKEPEESNCDDSASSIIETGETMETMETMETIETIENMETSIEELLEHQCSLEKLDAENVWTCDKCNVKNRPYRRMSYWQLPEILILSLKRFSYEQIGFEFIPKKINTKVNYDPFGFLDMEPYLSNSLSETKFVLYAIICHTGTLDSGHYYAYCRNLKTEKPIWLKYNDEDITEVRHLDRLITKDAYVLLYQRLDTVTL